MGTMKFNNLSIYDRNLIKQIQSFSTICGKMAHYAKVAQQSNLHNYFHRVNLKFK